MVDTLSLPTSDDRSGGNDARVGQTTTCSLLLDAGARALDLQTGGVVKAGSLANIQPGLPLNDVASHEAWRITTRLGRSLTVGGNAYFPTNRGFLPASRLKPGDRVAVPRELGLFGDDPVLTKAQVTILGYLIGDGGLTNGSPVMTTNSPAILAEIEAISEPLGVAVVRTSHDNRCPSYRLPNRQRRKGISNPLIDFLREHGIMSKGSHDKFVPEAVFRLPRNDVALFLNRLFATDGSAWMKDKSFGRISYASVSPRLINDVQHLLLRFGINARVRRRQVKYKGERRRSFELEVMAAPDILRFTEEIGIFSKEEAVDRVRQHVSEVGIGFTRDTLPVEVWNLVDVARHPRSWAEISRAAGRPSCHNWHPHRRNPRRETLRELAGVVESTTLLDLADANAYWDSVVAVEHPHDARLVAAEFPRGFVPVVDDMYVVPGA